MLMEAFSKATGKPLEPTSGCSAAFTKAAEKPEGSGNRFLEAILEERPDLKDKTAYFPEQGSFGYTVFIGDEVFKGPRHSMYIDNIGQYVREFEHEADALQELEGKDLPVPRVTCRGKNTVFYGMTRLPGVTFDSVQPQMSEAELKSLANEIADFMMDMAKKVPRENGLYAMQGDLREPNVLVDPQTKKLSGIIDFGMACNVTKADLVPRWIKSWEFKSLVNEALSKKKAELPDSPAGARSQYVSSDPGLRTRMGF